MTFVTALTVVLATLFPDRLAAVAGAEELGVLAMHVFFAVLGASANIAVVARAGPALFVFCAVVLLVHLLVIVLACWPLRLDLAEVIVASNANIGGPTTAAAMATAGGWTALVIPAIYPWFAPRHSTELAADSFGLSHPQTPQP